MKKTARKKQASRKVKTKAARGRPTKRLGDKTREGNFPVKATQFATVWQNHPGKQVYPCDKSTYPNQCAIRLGKALEDSGLSTSNFTGARCSLHRPGHIRGAQDLADWLRSSKRQGEPGIIEKGGDRTQMTNTKGIVFIQNGWPLGGDHIDLWSGSGLKGGNAEWLDLGRIWFWKIT